MRLSVIFLIIAMVGSSTILDFFKPSDILLTLLEATREDPATQGYTYADVQVEHTLAVRNLIEYFKAEKPLMELVSTSTTYCLV